MSSILPLRSLVIHHSYLGSIQQGGGLEAVTRALPFHIAAGQAVELVINDRRKPLKGGLISRLQARRRVLMLLSSASPWAGLSIAL